MEQHGRFYTLGGVSLRSRLRERLRLWAIGSVSAFNSIAYFRALRLAPRQWTGAALILGAVAFENPGALRRAMMGLPARSQ